MTRRNLKTMPKEPFRAHVDSMAHDGRGVAHLDGKATFIEGALPGEEVMFHYITRRKRFDEGVTSEILSPSPDRVEPRCPHFNLCGGCSLQHMSPAAQLRAKETILLENLRRIGDVAPETILPPLAGPAWGYRRRARLGAKYVDKKESMLAGFHEKRSSLLAELTRCEVLLPEVGGRIMELRGLLRGLDAYNRIPQVEVAAGDEGIALIFRNLIPLSERDAKALCEFGAAHDFQIYLQPAGPESMTLIAPREAELSYQLPAHDVRLFFRPGDFTQVNAGINRLMVGRALELLDVRRHERVLDLFCGIGNFTLPLARRAAHVTGVEGVASAITRARDNARRNALANVEFHVADLADPAADWPWAKQRFDKILIDPPRTGALETIKRFNELSAPRVVYISCNPATFARDAAELVHAHGYRFVSAGVMDMFPHTTHVECISLFERKG